MNKLVINKDNIQNKIYTIRGISIMLDRDLAELYQVETRVLKQAVKRNMERFPKDFMFELTENEIDFMVSQSVIPSRQYLGGSKPFVFTEEGVSMLSSVLKSKIAIEVNIAIFRAFAKMRKLLLSNASIFQRLDNIEYKLLKYDNNFNKVFEAIEDKNIKPIQGIFHDGQIYDAYSFVNDLLKSAKNEVVLVDNYIDDTVLTLFSKYSSINFTITTKPIQKQLKLDIEKYNSQYNNLEVKISNKYHDRFLIIDNKEAYHLGASLKDLGKKVFGFNKIDVVLLQEVL